MASAAKKTFITPEEYLAIERAANSKSEYRDGQIYAMSGVSRPHSLITTNLSRHIANQLEGRDCELHIADMKVRIQRTGSYCYPDLVIVCGEPRLEDRVADTLLNPTVIIEILSPSTEVYDRGVKFADYREIESLSDYILVAQHKVLIERYTRREDGWVITFFRQSDEILHLPSINCELVLRDIYAKVPLTEGDPIFGG
jgi:Uma2 family endonuclease